MITKKYTPKIIANTVLLLFSLSCLLPVLLLAISSITDEQALIIRGYSFFPSKLSLESYKYIFQIGASIVRAYGISLILTLIGTCANIFLTIFLSYPLSRNIKGKTVITFFVFFTLLFNGGLVPTYIIYSQLLHIKDTLWAQLVPRLMLSPFNVILMRNYFVTSIPGGIIEAGKLDGASESSILFRIVIPISKPIIGTIGLMSGLAYWNDWQNGLYYLVRRTDYYNIQNVLTSILNNVQFLKSAGQSVGVHVDLKTIPSVGIRMAIAMLAIIPVIIIYPFIQKSFVKGIVIGGVKG